MSIIPGAQQGRWTITDQYGLESIVFTSFISLNATASSQAPDQPVEQGGFFTYNKISQPRDVSVSLAVQGDELVQQITLDGLERLCKQASLLNITTPAGEIRSLTLTSFTYGRSRESGAGLLTVELKLKEVREIATQYSESDITLDQAANPDDVTSIDRGILGAISLEVPQWANDTLDLLKQGRDMAVEVKNLVTGGPAVWTKAAERVLGTNITWVDPIIATYLNYR